MSELYTKTKEGRFVPIDFKEIITKDWNDKLVVVKIGSESLPACEEDFSQAVQCLIDAEATDHLDNVSFIVTEKDIEFEVLSSLKDIEDKFISIAVTKADDLSHLGTIQTKAKEMLRGLTKKVVTMPSPLTVKEYRKVMEIKGRCYN